jgi:putative transcriptional regulator
MDIYSNTDIVLLKQIGHHLKSIRLNRNLTQESLALAIGISVNSIKALELGKTKLSTLVAVLRELRALEELLPLLEENHISPIMLAKLNGKSRQRASRK